MTIHNFIKMPTNEKKNYFDILFSRIIFLVLSMIIVLAISLSIFSSSFILDTLKRLNSDLFSQISYNANYQNNQVKLTMLSFLNDDRILRLYNKEECSIPEINRAFNQINSLNQSDIASFSVYIYNAKTDTYYITGSKRMMRQGTFYDEEIVQIINTPNSYEPGIPFIRTIPKSELHPDKLLNVFTYIFPENYIDLENRTNSVIVNIAIDDFLNRITYKNEIMEYSNIFLLSKSGILVNNSTAASELINGLDYEYVNDILSSPKTTDYFVSYINGEKHIIFYNYLPSLETYLVNAISYNKLLSQMNIFRVMIFAITALTILLAICISYFLSKRIYMPINNIFSMINHLSSPAKKSADYTLDDIVKNLDTLRERKDYLEAFEKRNKSYMKNNQLKRLLYDTDTEAITLPQSTLFSKSNDRQRQYILCLFTIDNFSNFSKMSEDDCSLYKFSLMNIASEIISAYFPLEMINPHPEHVTALIDVTGTENFYEELTPLIQKIQMVYAEYFNFTLSAFVSQTANELHTIPLCYNATRELSLYRLLLGHQSILTQPEYEQYEWKNFVITYNNLKPILDLINLSRTEEALNELHQLFTLLKECTYQNVLTSISRLSIYIGDLSSYSNMPMSTHSLLQLETLDDIEHCLIDLINRNYEQKQSERNHRTENTIQFITDYIGNHYSDPNLSPKSIADELNLSVRYVNKIFYDYTQKSLQSYINEYRIELSKEMLKNNSLTIKEIVYKIGWPNQKYFYTIFKKSTGFTPSEYRSHSTHSSH